MTAIAVFWLLAAAFFACAAQYHRDRARNLEYQLDDAQCNAAYWQERTGALICENNTLVVDLYHSEQRLAWLESIHQARKGETAGVRLVARPVDAKLTVQKELP